MSPRQEEEGEAGGAGREEAMMGAGGKGCGAISGWRIASSSRWCPRDPTPRACHVVFVLRAPSVTPPPVLYCTCGSSTAQEQEGFASMSGELQVHASIVGFLAWLGGELSLDAPNGMLGEVRVRARSLA